MSAKKCALCYFRKRVTGFNEKTFACHYAVETGRLRECSPEHCDKFMPRAATKANKRPFMPNLLEQTDEGGESWNE